METFCNEQEAAQGEARALKIRKRESRGYSKGSITWKSQAKQKFHCKKCKRSFPRLQILLQHFRDSGRHRGEEVANAAAEQLSKWMAAQSERQHCCPTCCLGFKIEADLWMHLKHTEVHKDSSEARQAAELLSPQDHIMRDFGNLPVTGWKYLFEAMSYSEPVSRAMKVAADGVQSPVVTEAARASLAYIKASQAAPQAASGNRGDAAAPQAGSSCRPQCQNGAELDGTIATNEDASLPQADEGQAMADDPASSGAGVQQGTSCNNAQSDQQGHSQQMKRHLQQASEQSQSAQQPQIQDQQDQRQDQLEQRQLQQDQGQDQPRSWQDQQGSQQDQQASGQDEQDQRRSGRDPQNCPQKTSHLRSLHKRHISKKRKVTISSGAKDRADKLFKETRAHGGVAAQAADMAESIYMDIFDKVNARRFMLIEPEPYSSQVSSQERQSEQVSEQQQQQPPNSSQVSSQEPKCQKAAEHQHQTSQPGTVDQAQIQTNA